MVESSGFHVFEAKLELKLNAKYRFHEIWQISWIKSGRFHEIWQIS